MTESITTSALLRLGAARLAGLPQPHQEAQVLLAHVLAVPRSQLLSHPETPRSPAERGRYLALIDRRLAGEPAAYLLGRREFWSLTLEVTSAVLVPRPETELLVERVLALLDPAPARVADLGTGSGAIALALAAERPAWQVSASDASGAALAVARANAARLGLAVEFLHGPWFDPLGARRFHAIASNPPYVAAGDPALAALAAEPYAALTPGPDALAALRHLVRGAPAHLAPGGWLALEHGATQAAAVRAELVARGFGHVRSHRDLAGHERVSEGRWLGRHRRWPRATRHCPEGMTDMVRFQTTLGDFTIELFPKEAPVTVENFLRYVREEFFDGTIFHRVIPGFVIQGGGLTPDMEQKANHAPIRNEADNGLKNGRGTLSMARTNDIHSATSQFFVNLKDNDFLDHKTGSHGYAVFGRVTQGMDVVDRIAAVQTGRRRGHQDVPLEDVMVVSAREVTA